MEFFCKECVYYAFFEEHPVISAGSPYILMYKDEACQAPENSTQKNTYYQKIEIRKRLPNEINKDNNCTWFTAKDNTFIRRTK